MAQRHATFTSLDDDLVSAVVHQLSSALELGVASMVSARLRRACTAEAEARCRARIERGCDYGACPPARPEAWALSKWSLDFNLYEMVGYAADCAGGWSRLLAGREGFLETRRRFAGDDPRPSDAEPLPLSQVACFCVLWEVGTRDDGVTWTGILPLAHWLPSLPEGRDVIRPSGGPSLCSGARPHGDGFSLLAGPLDDARSWWVCASIVGHGFGEVGLRPLSIEPWVIAMLPPRGPGIVRFGSATAGGAHGPRWFEAPVHTSESRDGRGEAFVRHYYDYAADAADAAYAWVPRRDAPPPPRPLGAADRARAFERETFAIDSARDQRVGVFTYALDLHVTHPSSVRSPPAYHVDVALCVNGSWRDALDSIAELSLAERKTVN